MKVSLRNFVLFLFLCIPCLKCDAAARQILKENIVKANPGDFLVTAQGKNFTALHIRDKGPNHLIIEEVTAPASRIPRYRYTWREWIENNAPGHTAWVRYDLNTETGTMQNAFSYTKNCWFRIPEADNFLSRLLSLGFQQIPDRDRKRVGPRQRHSGMQERPLWQPKLVVDSKPVPDAEFTAWKTRWPNDNSELSGKMIEVYIPKDDERYPSYFPYWLEISGVVGSAKVRIVDSGKDLKSPKPEMTMWNAVVQ